MVDVGAKDISQRTALAVGVVSAQAETLQQLTIINWLRARCWQRRGLPVVQAAKRCADLIPLCHPLASRYS